MDSTGEQLHPNWRALTTIHLPLKRFVPEGAESIAKGTVLSHKSHIEGVTGEEAQTYYEKVLNEYRNPKKKRSSKGQKEEISSCYTNKQELIPFNKEKYLRCAQTNNVAELRRFNYQAEDLNVTDNFGWTALMIAACEGAEEVVNFLLTLGVDRNVRDKRGNTALDLARTKVYWHIAELLEKKQEEVTINENKEIVKMSQIEPFYCEICKRTFTESTRIEHDTSTLHKFNDKSTKTGNKLEKFNIPAHHRGLQLMLKQGWDRESGLGPNQSGRLYPVKTVIRKQRSGLGIQQPPARVTHISIAPTTYKKNKHRNRNDIRREKQREWKRERRLRNELS